MTYPKSGNRRNGSSSSTNAKRPSHPVGTSYFWPVRSNAEAVSTLLLSCFSKAGRTFVPTCLKSALPNPHQPWYSPPSGSVPKHVLCELHGVPLKPPIPFTPIFDGVGGFSTDHNIPSTRSDSAAKTPFSRAKSKAEQRRMMRANSTRSQAPSRFCPDGDGERQ